MSGTWSSAEKPAENSTNPCPDDPWGNPIFRQRPPAWADCTSHGMNWASQCGRTRSKAFNLWLRSGRRRFITLILLAWTAACATGTLGFHKWGPCNEYEDASLPRSAMDNINFPSPSFRPMRDTGPWNRSKDAFNRGCTRPSHCAAVFKFSIDKLTKERFFTASGVITFSWISPTSKLWCIFASRRGVIDFET